MGGLDPGITWNENGEEEYRSIWSTDVTVRSS